MASTQADQGDFLSRHLPFLRSTTRSIFVVLLIALSWRFLAFRNPDPQGYDETVYCFYAQTLGEHGWHGLREVVHAWPGNPVLNKAPLPYRLFFIVPGMWTCRLLGGYTVANIALLSSLFGLAFIVVAWVLARRWFGPALGMLVAITMIFSPLATALSNRALQDTCFAFVVTACILLYDQCWRHSRKRDIWLFGLALLAGFLTKESMVVLYPSFVLAGICYARRAGWRSKVPILIPFVLAPVLHIVIMSWLSGGLGECCRTYRAYAAQQGQIPYALKYQSGPWFGYLVDFILLSPLAVMFAAIGARYSSADNDNAQGRSLALIYLLTGLVTFSLLSLRNVRLVLFLEPYLLAFSILGIFSLGKRLFSNLRFQAVAVMLLLALLVWSEIAQYTSIFVESGVYDPVTINLIHAAGFVH